jgi:hypothetical protein
MRTSERGVALIMVILVLLVLTVLGITAVMLMTQEDRISSRQDLQKAALYAAEAGLRRGELVFTSTKFTPDQLNALLRHTAAAHTPAVTPDVPVQPPPWSGVGNLGTYLLEAPNSAVEIANREVTQLVSGGGTFSRIRAYYSVYVRNNPEDLDSAGLQVPLTNFDSRLRLISVGFITDGDGVDNNGKAKVLAVKIIEEEFNWAGAPEASSAQKLMNAGGTSSGLWTGSGD